MYEIWLNRIWDGTLTNALPLLFIGFMIWRVRKIEGKLDTFVTKETIDLLKEARDRERTLTEAAQQATIAALRGEISVIRNDQPRQGQGEPK